MKKFVLSCLFVLSMVNVKANNVMSLLHSIDEEKIESVICNDSIDNKNFNFKYNQEQFRKYLNIDDKDSFILDIQDDFVDNMNLASNAKTIEEQNKIIYNGLTYCTSNMRKLLSDRQYRDYLTFLNFSLLNRGFNNDIDFYKNN
jgi:spore coat polysaccharide biosynthesis predicted glycosyltransferase SpsG